MQRVMVFGRITAGEVNRAARTFDGAAGKSINVAKVLHALGEHVMATGFLGGDRGAFLQRYLEARGLTLDFVTVTPPTRQCVTLIEEDTATVTELVEESQPVRAEDYERLLDLVRRHLGDCRAVVMSGTIAAGGPADLYARVTRLAGEAGALAIVDASGAALIEALKARPDVVKPNRAELAATLGQALPGEAEVRSAMRVLSERGARQVVVTAGAEPSLAFDGRRFWRIAAPRVAAVNPIGSGDAFTAALTWRLVGGDVLGEACRWGVAAGAANALTLLAGEVDRAEVERLVSKTQLEGV